MLVRATRTACAEMMPMLDLLGRAMLAEIGLKESWHDRCVSCWYTCRFFLTFSVSLPVDEELLVAVLTKALCE